ncbi:hypothetical protein B0I35DRAFT_449295 [Stachybotrys elegans]|uniref:Zn(2)-C6 fungal-type domain-containing protein n=1 Tax=Stachybotrys elegans TaxID=80388 RepID=A0A8K0SYI5_9HYPO|nr:hypothetical protein B0I35DRAFT_449295 [Stachybotrys elegans]
MSRTKTGCQTCRCRRIKCDEGKPVCLQCIKAERECRQGSDRKKPDLVFHTENMYASGNIKRPRGPRGSLTLQRPGADRLSQARAFYINFYLDGLSEAPVTTSSMLEGLTEWISARRESAMVDRAVSAVALAVFSGTQHSPSAAKEATKIYGDLLHLVQAEIMNRDLGLCSGQMVDSSLLTIVLMATYENIMHRPADEESDHSLGTLHSWSHHLGALAVLQSWYENSRVHITPSTIVKYSRRGIMRRALLMGSALPLWLRDGSDFGESGVDLVFDGILFRLVNLRHRLDSVLRHAHGIHPVDADVLANEAAELDAACQQWENSIPQCWLPRTQDSSPCRRNPEHGIFPPLVSTYTEPSYATVWLEYLTIKILLKSTMIQISKIRQVTARAENMEETMQREGLVESCTRIIPFILGRMSLDDREKLEQPPGTAPDSTRPSLIISTGWPLTVLSYHQGIDAEHKAWFRSRLVRIGGILGDGSLKCAGHGGWAHNVV